MRMEDSPEAAAGLDERAPRDRERVAFERGHDARRWLGRRLFGGVAGCNFLGLLFVLFFGLLPLGFAFNNLGYELFVGRSEVRSSDWASATCAVGKGARRGGYFGRSTFADGRGCWLQRDVDPCDGLARFDDYRLRFGEQQHVIIVLLLVPLGWAEFNPIWPRFECEEIAVFAASVGDHAVGNQPRPTFIACAHINAFQWCPRSSCGYPSGYPATFVHSRVDTGGGYTANHRNGLRVFGPHGHPWVVLA